MKAKSVFRLCEGVQVRKEDFGLLFYQYAGPKLFFVPSGDLVEESFFRDETTFDDLICFLRDSSECPDETIETRLSRLLSLLKSKDLVYEQSIC